MSRPEPMILCNGEALIDMLPGQSPTGARTFEPRCGGSVFNTAVTVARLGAPSGFFGGLSTDLFGEMLATRLEESGVDFRWAIRSRRPTTLAFVGLDQGQASYTFYDENTAARMLLDEDLSRVPETATALFFGGISLAVEPCATTYETMLCDARADCPVMVDFNVRPDLGPDNPVYRARIERIMKRADIVKVSDEDLALFYGDGDVVASARRLLEDGPSLVCLTRGSRGALGLTAQSEIAVAPPKITVVDTVGAGDSFNGGVLASLFDSGKLSRDELRELSEDDLRAAISLGVRVAAVTASREGADPPRRSELLGSTGPETHSC